MSENFFPHFSHCELERRNILVEDCEMGRLANACVCVCVCVCVYLCNLQANTFGHSVVMASFSVPNPDYPILDQKDTLH